MLRILLCTLLALQVSYGWEWDWNWDWNRPCSYLNHINCDTGPYSRDSYDIRDGDRDGDRHGDRDGDHDGNRHRDGDKQICGSDGVTYKNRCFFVKAQCKNKIEMRHEGPCTTVMTDAPQQTTPKAQLLDEYCKKLLKQACHGVNPICATNGQSYDNDCEFEKAKCLDGNVHVKHLGTC